MKILYLPHEVEKMLREVVGNGGHQQLCRRLQDGLKRLETGQWELTATLEDIQKTIRYAEYGEGGYQGRMRPMVSAMKRKLLKLGLPLEPPAEAIQQGLGLD